MVNKLFKNKPHLDIILVDIIHAEPPVELQEIIPYQVKASKETHFNGAKNIPMTPKRRGLCRHLLECE